MIAPVAGEVIWTVFPGTIEYPACWVTERSTYIGGTGRFQYVTACGLVGVVHAGFLQQRNPGSALVLCPLCMYYCDEGLL